MRIVVALLTLCLTAWPVRAEAVDEAKVAEYLQAFWTAALWSTPVRPEFNAPAVLTKFAEGTKITVAVSGADAADRAQIAETLAPILALTGQAHEILAPGAPGEANVQLKILSFASGPGYACVTKRLPPFGPIRTTQLEVLNTRMDRCLAHEIMHVLGFTGHPQSSNSVLSYTRQLTAYTEIDRMMVRVLYDPRLKPGMRHVQAIAAAREVLVDKLVAGGAPEAVRDMGRNFVDGVPRELDALIAGDGLSKFGNAQARYHLAIAYTYGDVVAKDEAAGYRRFRAAAERYPEAVEFQFQIGYALHSGRGTTPDPAEGVAWYRQAAAHGHSIAQNNLGFAYREGKGVERDRIEAYKWFELAARRGNALAARNRAKLQQELGSADVQEAARRADAWKPDHSENADH